MAFKPVSSQVNFAEQEVKTLQYWKANKIFEKSISSRPEDKRWTFLDGPPFVTGMPHYGSLLSSLPKDLFGRYWTMKGYRVRRVWGWDGHGLPIENKVETELKIARKRDIEEVVGVKKFVDECKQYVEQMSSDWEWYVDRIGRWVDFENAYKTWNTPYMESVMWVFKQMYDGGHIYKGHKVSMYCPHCSTPISNFEVAMDAENYKEVVDAATTYKFELIDQPGTYILAWSTTPWNKIVTTALAINPNLAYVTVKQGDEQYILAESTLKMLGNEATYQIISRHQGSELTGIKYQPHYDYFRDEAKGKKVFEVVPADFVTAEDGTGVVTIAAYGEDDLKLMQDLGLHIQTHLDDEGTISSDVPQFGGMYYLKANKEVDLDLQQRGLIYKIEEHPHRVPLCWRCHTRLYYAPINAWYVDVQSLKPLLKSTNEQINWFPNHFKHGRFLKSLESAPDWNISRNRYWGSPVPVWECECGERFVPGSIKELEDASGQTVTGLHKPEIDEIAVRCKQCGQQTHRTPEVLDSWIEAGSASFAERHFPFNTDEELEDFFPPDFIGEYTGQIRAWFYVLHVIGAALYKSPAYKNVIVEGVILGTDGRKMSKNFKNYPDPATMLDTYGGDALRLYLLGSPVMHGEDILISEESYRNQVRGTMLILWNVYNFFITYANLDQWSPDETKSAKTIEAHNVLDDWILSLLQRLNVTVTNGLESYDTVIAIEAIKQFVADFSTWYIRRSRDRVGPTARNEHDKAAFYTTSYTVLTTLAKLMAPITPFIAEEMYRNLSDKESVHLEMWPMPDLTLINDELERKIKLARLIVEVGHAVRSEQKLKLKQPLMAAFYRAPEELPANVVEDIRLELNVLTIEFKSKADRVEVEYDQTITDELRDMGQARGIVRLVQAARKELGCALDDKVVVTLPEWPKSQEEEIMRLTLATKLVQGDELAVEVVK